MLTFRLNVLENGCLTTKSKARVSHFLLGDQQQHSLGGWERGSSALRHSESKCSMSKPVNFTRNDELTMEVYL